MYKTPQSEDEQSEYIPQRRKRQVRPPRRLQMEHGPDEHPEIPKIRRASLYLDQQTPHSPPKPVEEEVEEEDSEQEIDMEEREHMPRARPPRQDTSKISVARRHRSYVSPVYTPPPRAYHTRPHTRPKRSLKEQAIHISHSQPFIIICSLLIVLLLIGMIVANIGRSQPQASKFLNGVSTTPPAHTGTPPSGIQRAGDPHELVIIPQDTDHPPPAVYATSAYLLDADTGATLYAHNPFMHLPMMSTTKLMTAVIAIEQGNPDQKVTITNAIDHDISQLSADSTVFGLKKGETYTLRDMLYALLLVSGNDAAIAIADTLAGDQQHFVAKMNQRAYELGLYDTHYMNPHGLLATGHFSSAHDLAILGQYSLSIPLIHQISGTQVYTVPKTATHPDHPMINGNQFLWWYPGVDGGKPGFDGGSNFVQVISCIHNHHHLIGVTMHTINWWTDMRDLMNWGFDNFKWISPHDVDSYQNPIPFDSQWNYFVSDKKESTIPTADNGRYYIYTGYSISGSILTYFDKNGGLTHFGYPISLPTVSSNSIISQRFEQTTIQCSLITKLCSTA